MNPTFRPERLGDQHERSAFACGEDALDRYFKTQVTQDIRRRIANCFLIVESATDTVAAYYTISASSFPLVDLPADEVRRLPRYPSVPAVRMGRLAVDQRFQGQGLGAAMLADAVSRTLRAEPAVFTLLADAKNERAAAFYRRFGFRDLSDLPSTLFLPLAATVKAFVQNDAHP